MNPEDIVDRVAAYYTDFKQQPLLLSEFGTMLRDAGLWPMEHESRTLAEVVEESAPSVKLIRDPDAAAYVIVVPVGKEEIAHRTIQYRHDVRFLESLHRPILLAFCAKVSSDSQVYVSRDPPYRYSFRRENSDLMHVIIDEDFRMPGLYIENIHLVEKDSILRLASNVRQWAKKHGISVEQLLKKDDLKEIGRQPKKPATNRPGNALERLIASQPPELAGKLVVPADIALALSRMP